jgi:diacylglycerol kinase
MSKFRSSNIANKIAYSYDGFKSSVQDFSVRLAYAISLPVSILYFIFAPNLTTKLLSSFIFLFWIVFESLNTSIETVVDRISQKKHPLSKIAKDIPSFVNAMIVLFFIFAIVMLAFITKYAYDEWEEANPDGSMSDYINQTFKK